MTSPLRVASYNVNSLRKRLGALRRFVGKYQPEVLCLQETKVEDALFPESALRRMGYRDVLVAGQKGYHGVAIASRLPLAGSFSRDIGRLGESRHVAATLPDGTEVHSLYVPSGGPEPDADKNPNFAKKLRFMRALTRWMRGWSDKGRILAGDLNVAPLEHDVWLHEKMRRTITHTALEIRELRRVQRAGAWIDVARQLVPSDRKLYTWWSYRNPAWRKVDKGRRLDHIWVSPALGGSIRDFHVAKEVRGWTRPSDHAPIIATLGPP